MIEQSVRQRRPLPPKIANAPELKLGNEIYYEGFLELTSCRQVGLALGPLPMTAILTYCGYYDITGELREDFIWIMVHVDQKYLEWSASRGAKHAKRT